ncbi:MAG: TPM domain-containing protein [Terriglobales bacterium]
MPTLRRWLVAPVLLALLSLGLAAVSVQQLKPTGYVNDFAGVLSPGEKAELTQQIQAIQNAFGIQIALVTVKSLQGGSAFDLAYHFAHTWGVGYKGKDNGLLILLAIQDRKYSTQVGYGLEPYITDADAGSWARSLIPQLKAGQYGAFFSGMLADASQTLSVRMGRAAPSAAGSAQRLAAVPLSRRSGIPWQTIIFLIVIFSAFSLMGRFGGNASGCLWLPLLFGGFGGFGGGGWGGGGGFGGGGGGGFGGFGGGGFGGGGAGGGW